MIASMCEDNLEALRFLLSKYPDFQITEAAVVAAAGNTRGIAPLQFLLLKYPDFQITENVVLRAATRISESVEALDFLQSQYPDL